MAYALFFRRQPHFPGISAVERRHCAVSGKMSPGSARGRSVSRPFSPGRRDSGPVSADSFLYAQSRTKTEIIRAAAGKPAPLRIRNCRIGTSSGIQLCTVRNPDPAAGKLYNFVRFVPMPFVPAILNEVYCSF